MIPTYIVTVIIFYINHKKKSYLHKSLKFCFIIEIAIILNIKSLIKKIAIIQIFNSQIIELIDSKMLKDSNQPK